MLIWMKQMDFPLYYTDNDINKLISQIKEGGIQGSKHYTQNEEFFLKLPEEYPIPSLPIHHDVRVSKPSAEYLHLVKGILSDLIKLEPALFNGLTYYFDPKDILRPGFFQLYKLGDRHYLYTLKIDLNFHPGSMEILCKEGNDRTPFIRTDRLFLSSEIIPIERVHRENDRIIGFDVFTIISKTWIGETGRGYFVKGIWIDNELTKFFSKLFIPKGIKCYPYYPFRCIYRSICQEVIHPTPERRKTLLPYLHKAIEFLNPHLEKIQTSIKNQGFSDNNPIFQKMKTQVPPYWNKLFQSLKVTTYLNDQEQREFEIDEGLES